MKVLFNKALLLLCSLLLFFSCTRDDIAEVVATKSDAQITFTVSANNMTTKSGDTTVIDTTSKVLSNELIGSYNDEDIYLIAIEEDWSIEPEAEDKSSLSTKASLITTDNITDEVIGVITYTFSASGYDFHLYSGLTKAYYNASTNKWIPETTIDWPNTGNYLLFNAYAPANHVALNPDNVTVPNTLSILDATTSPTISYTVNSDYNQQADLVVSGAVLTRDDPTLGKTCQPLTFNHALTGIRFKVARGIDVKSIEISGVYNTGAINLRKRTWSIETAETDTYTISESDGSALILKEEEGDYVSLDDKYTLMMLPTNDLTPAHLPANAQIKVTFSDGGTVVGNIGGHKWEQGKMITYLISQKATLYGYWEFDVTLPTNLTASGISSINVISKGARRPGATGSYVGWTVEGFYKNETDAKAKRYSGRYRDDLSDCFLTSFPTQGSGLPNTPMGMGNYEQVVFEYELPAPTKKIKYPSYHRNEYIKSRTPKGDVYRAYDLSTAGGQANVYSANTYIVNGPGWYCFPLIMGNGVVDGNLNPDAYPSNFKDYKSEPISSPYLHNSSSAAGTPTYAYVGWANYDFIEVAGPLEDSRFRESGNNIEAWCLTGADYPDMSPAPTPWRGIRRINGTYYALFSIPQEKCTRQGIATIVIADENKEIMWSYLVWLTDYDLRTGGGISESALGQRENDKSIITYKDVTQPNGATKGYTVMPRNLGAVLNQTLEIEVYNASEEVYVRFEQDGSGLYKIIKLQTPIIENVLSASLEISPCYQWGRPFALMPFVLKYENEKYSVSKTNFDFGYYSCQFESVNTQTLEYGQMDIGRTIKNAPFFIPGLSSRNRWLNDNPYNLWDANNLSDDYSSPVTTQIQPSKKTIYDPCPVGYKLPELGTFNLFALTDRLSENPLSINSSFKIYQGDINGNQEYTNFSANWFLRTDINSSSTSNGWSMKFYAVVPYRSTEHNSLSVSDEYSNTDGIFWLSNYSRVDGRLGSYTLYGRSLKIDPVNKTVIPSYFSEVDDYALPIRPIRE